MLTRVPGGAKIPEEDSNGSKIDTNHIFFGMDDIGSGLVGNFGVGGERRRDEKGYEKDCEPFLFVAMRRAANRAPSAGNPEHRVLENKDTFAAPCTVAVAKRQSRNAGDG